MTKTECQQTTTHEVYTPTHKRFGCIIKQGDAMNTNEWITDRLPMEEDTLMAKYVWGCIGTDVIVAHYKNVCPNEPWQPITPPEPYVKPKRWTAEWVESGVSWPCWVIRSASKATPTFLHSLYDEEKHREAAERIAAIYEEVMP